LQGRCGDVLNDEVRRAVTQPYLQQAEASVVSRSCFPWFAASPRQLRSRQGASAA